MIAGSLVQQADFQHVVNARQHLGQLKRFADEILRADLQSAQLVAWLGGDDQHREVAVQFNFLEPLNDLESVHGGHLQIEQDQVIAVLEVKFADLARIHGGCDGTIAGALQYPFEQNDVDFLIVYDQDFAVNNVRCIYQENPCTLFVLSKFYTCKFQCFIQRVHKLIDLDRLGHIAEEAGFHAFLDIARHGIGTEGNDGDVRCGRV